MGVPVKRRAPETRARPTQLSVSTSSSCRRTGLRQTLDDVGPRILCFSPSPPTRRSARCERWWRFGFRGRGVERTRRPAHDRPITRGQVSSRSLMAAQPFGEPVFLTGVFGFRGEELLVGPQGTPLRSGAVPCTFALASPLKFPVATRGDAVLHQLCG